MVRVNIDDALRFLDRSMFESIDAGAALNRLNSHYGTGWMSLPSDFSPDLSQSINDAAKKISGESEVLVVAGIGGSYLGARAALEFIKSPFYNSLNKNAPDILFAGNNASAEYLSQILELIGNRDFSVNVVSKSGSTLETAVALRVFKDLLVTRYGTDGIKNRLYVTTDKTGSQLYETAQREGCTRFTIPDGVGGRYSVLTAVGLLPCAVAGIDINRLMSGAREELETGIETACLYACARQALYRSGRKIELLACFEPAFRSMGEWWKQLFGESEGKDGLGIFPALADYTADLHSLGQYVQDGERSLMETFVTFSQSRAEVKIPGGTIHDDRIAALAGRGLSEVNRAASEAVKRAHIDGGVPVIELTLPAMSEEAFGALAYFLERACAVSALISGVDPFGQPGVEAYKGNLYSILGMKK